MGKFVSTLDFGVASYLETIWNYRNWLTMELSVSSVFYARRVLINFQLLPSKMLNWPMNN